MGGTLTKYAAIESMRKTPSNNVQVAPNELRYWLHSRTIEMTRGGTLSWWDGLEDDDEETRTEESVTETDDTNMKYLDAAGHYKATGLSNNANNNTEPPKDPGNMTYLCDSSLGEAPDPTDCEKLSWSGLKPPDSIETLEPHTPKFYSQGMYLAFLPSINSLTPEKPFSAASSKSNPTPQLTPPRNMHPRPLHHIPPLHNDILVPPPRSLLHPPQPLPPKPHRVPKGRSRLLRPTRRQLVDYW